MSNPIAERLVSPFVAERFLQTERLEALIAPPYDVIDDGLRETLLARDPHNVVRLILPEGNGDKYARAADVLAEWRSEGVIVRDDEPSVSILRQEFALRDGTRRSRTGMLAAVAVEPYGTGRVKPHEKTHAGPKADRLALLRTTDTVLDALFMLSRDEDNRLRDALERATRETPVASFEFDGVDTTIWRVGGQRAHDLADRAQAASLYVADGHHRYETAISYREEKPRATHAVALIVPLGDPGLVVLPTHRLIHGEPVDVDRVVEGLRDWFQLHEVSRDVNYVERLTALRERGTGCIVTPPTGNAIALLMKPDASLADLPFTAEPSVASLDVARIDGLVVAKLVEAAGPDAHVSYSPDADRVIEAVVAGESVAGVLVNPTSVDQVLRVADAGAAMPQKATYFAPKVPSGLVFLNFEG